MKFLLLLLGISFFFIFFTLSGLPISQNSFFGNIFLEAHAYIGISILFIALIFRAEHTKKEIPEKEIFENKEEIVKNVKQNFICGVKKFFTSYIYYIACILFYISLFIIFRSLLGELHIPRIFLFFNILVLALYFLEHKIKIFQDFIRVNTLVISLYYIVVHMLYLTGFMEGFLLEDILNIIILFILFYLLFTSTRLKTYIPVLVSYMFSFVFLELSVAIKYFGGDVKQLLMHIAFFFSLLFLGQTDLFAKLFRVKKSFIRTWGLIFSYITVICIAINIFRDTMSLFPIFAELGVLMYVLYLFHLRFQNYISLFFSSISLILSGYLVCELLFSLNDRGYYLPIFFFVFSGVYIAFDRIKKGKYIYDTYFFHIFSILVNLCGVISFFLFWDISILKVGILLLGESLYFFFSYYTLRKISHTG